jgi:hypothetical protein
MNNIWLLAMIRILIASFLFETVRPYFFFIPRPAGSKVSNEQSLDASKDNYVGKNIFQRKKFVNILLYLINITLVYSSIYIPLIIMSLKEKREMFLDEAKQFGTILPHLSISSENDAMVVVMIAIIISVLFIYLSRIIIESLKLFIKVKENIFSIIEFVVYIVFSLALCGLVVLEFYNFKAKYAFLLPFIVFILLIAIVTSANKKSVN